MRIGVKELVWDEHNSSHISKHSVSVEEVEQVLIGKITAQPGHSNRFLVIGQAKSKRTLTIILAQKDKRVFYPVIATHTSRQ